MRWRIRPAPIYGCAEVPGDKSISHRALILAAISDGASQIDGISTGADVASTSACLESLGVEISRDRTRAEVRSTGRLQPPQRPLDAGNSGTTMRLLTGVLAAQPFASCLVGDESLTRRPMMRVVEPLREMGASIETADGCAPLLVKGGRLHGVRYVSSVASAQVKSALLLAGLFAQGVTTVIEPEPSRDHTERMLRALGVRVESAGRDVSVPGGQRPHSFNLSVPGDISSAAFLLVAGALSGRGVTVRSVGVNPTRTGLLRVLARMGSQVALTNERTVAGEPVADVTVRGRPTKPLSIGRSEIPGLIDELPLLALLATQLSGTSVIRDAAELRVKETDRIATVAAALTELGAAVEPRPDGFLIRGPTELHGARVSSAGDHRVGMMLAVAGTIAHGETIVDAAESAAVSFPGFAAAFRALGADIDED